MGGAGVMLSAVVYEGVGGIANLGENYQAHMTSHISHTLQVISLPGSSRLRLVYWSLSL